jgi:hypothetical protein
VSTSGGNILVAGCLLPLDTVQIGLPCGPIQTLWVSPSTVACLPGVLSRPWVVLMAHLIEPSLPSLAIAPPSGPDWLGTVDAVAPLKFGTVQVLVLGGKLAAG